MTCCAGAHELGGGVDRHEGCGDRVALVPAESGHLDRTASMPTSTCSLRPALVVTLLAAACSVGVPQGVPFDAAFPDPRELVTTDNPAGVRARLDNTNLPDTAAHHERLLGLLRSRDTLRAPHLVLLTRAVAIPGRNVSVVSGDRRWSYGPRGAGASARVLDQLLDEGLGRLTEVDRTSFGELLGASQSDATMRRYVERFLPTLDDGSPSALAQILDGMHGSPALQPFLAQHIANAGGLAGERGRMAFRQMRFDSDRLTVLQFVLAADPPLDGTQFVSLMKAFSFDSGREEAFARLLPRVKPLQLEDARAAAATFSFDAGREAAMATLGKAEVQISDALLVAFTQLSSFDSGRLACGMALAGRLHGAPDAGAAKDLLATFSFDTDRLEAVRVMAPRWSVLSTEARMALLTTFSFSSNRETAMPLLMK